MVSFKANGDKSQEDTKLLTGQNIAGAHWIGKGQVRQLEKKPNCARVIDYAFVLYSEEFWFVTT